MTFFRNHWNITFVCSLNTLKQLVTFTNKFRFASTLNVSEKKIHGKYINKVLMLTNFERDPSLWMHLARMLTVRWGLKTCILFCYTLYFELNAAWLIIQYVALWQQQCLFFSLVLQQSVFKPNQVSLYIKRKNFNVEAEASGNTSHLHKCLAK